MYCKGGNTGTDDPNTNTAVNPLYELPKEQWWFQHDRSCDLFPPPSGEFLEIPANGEFTVELAHNRGQTTLSDPDADRLEWPDGQDHPEDWNSWEGPGSTCLEDGALHTYNETNAAGTAWAISYESDLAKVTLENLVVFSTLQHTPWKRIATYQVPDLPACPEGGCHCAWLWVPDGCGQPNMYVAFESSCPCISPEQHMVSILFGYHSLGRKRSVLTSIARYMQGFKCTVTNATSQTPVAPAQAPVYCADDASKCVKGAKQMIAWHQQTGNNIETADGISPGYNEKCGWTNGAQHTIFGGQ